MLFTCLSLHFVFIHDSWAMKSLFTFSIYLSELKIEFTVHLQYLFDCIPGVIKGNYIIITREKPSMTYSIGFYCHSHKWSVELKTFRIFGEFKKSKRIVSYIGFQIATILMNLTYQVWANDNNIISWCKHQIKRRKRLTNCQG